MKNWNLQLLYKDIQDPQIEKDIQKSKKEVNNFVNKWSKNKEYLKDPYTLSLALQEYEKLMEDTGICKKPTYYIALSRSLNQEDKLLKAKENQLYTTCVQLENSIQFFILNISKLPKNKQAIFLNSKYLTKYKHFLQSCFNTAVYLLSDKEERVFNLKSKTSYSNWVDMTSQLLSKQMINVVDEKGKKKKVTYNEVSKYINSNNKEVRDFAAENFYKVNSRYLEIAEFEINSILEDKRNSDEYRNIKRVDLPRLLSDDIQSEVIDTLRESVTNHFDISQRYYKLKAKLLKQNTLAYYERNVNLGEVDKEYPFEESFNIVKSIFEKLDPEFSKILDVYISQGRYDVYPQKGKQGGAFCISVGSKYPTYILLNHNSKLEDVLTIAHESGHGIHTEYANTQNYLNQGYSTACAETASTFFEDFVLKEISKELDKRDKDILLLKSLEDDISSIFRQIACYNFELRLHTEFKQKGFLSIDEISNIFSDEMSKYLGSAVLKDKHMNTGWLYWSHIRNPFYTYSYATGLLISKYLQNIVRENKENIRYVKDFFKAGDSKSPKEIFEDIGIDISQKEFWESGILTIEDKLKYLEEQF